MMHRRVALTLAILVGGACAGAPTPSAPPTPTTTAHEAPPHPVAESSATPASSAGASDVPNPSPALLAKIKESEVGADTGWAGKEVQYPSDRRTAIVGFAWSACNYPGVHEIALVCVDNPAHYVNTPYDYLMKARLEWSGRTYVIIEYWTDTGEKRLESIWTIDPEMCWVQVPEGAAPKEILGG